MTPKSPIFMRFIGHPGKPCSKCGSINALINIAGGRQCTTCSPESREHYVLGYLKLSFGLWEDADDTSEKTDEKEPWCPVCHKHHDTTSPRHCVSWEAAIHEKFGVNKPPDQPINRNQPYLPDTSRTPNGNLSEWENRTFTSPMVWESGDQWIVLTRRKPVATATSTGNDGNGKFVSPIVYAELPEIGVELEMKGDLRTFNGVYGPGPVTVTSAGHDASGRAVLALSRGGRLIASGVVWPFEAASKTMIPLDALL